MSWERDNYVVGTRYYVVGMRKSCRGHEILCRGHEILCGGNEIIMSWERDKYFFYMSPQCCRKIGYSIDVLQ